MSGKTKIRNKKFRKIVIGVLIFSTLAYALAIRLLGVYGEPLHLLIILIILSVVYWLDKKGFNGVDFPRKRRRDFQSDNTLGKHGNSKHTGELSEREPLTETEN